MKVKKGRGGEVIQTLPTLELALCWIYVHPKLVHLYLFHNTLHAVISDCTYSATCLFYIQYCILREKVPFTENRIFPFLNFNPKIHSL